MPTNPFGDGKRPWRRVTAAARAVSTTVLGKGELAVTDDGKLLVPDGVKTLKDLEPLPDAASLRATYVALRGPWVAGTAFPKNSLVIQAGAVYLAAADVPARTTFTAADWQALGGAAVAAITTVLNGDGTFTSTGSGVTDNGDGTVTYLDSSVTDNGDGTFTLAA